MYLITNGKYLIIDTAVILVVCIQVYLKLLYMPFFTDDASV